MRLFNKDILILYKMQFCPLLTRNQLEEQRILHGLGHHRDKILGQKSPKRYHCEYES